MFEPALLKVAGTTTVVSRAGLHGLIMIPITVAAAEAAEACGGRFECGPCFRWTR